MSYEEIDFSNDDSFSSVSFWAYFKANPEVKRARDEQAQRIRKLRASSDPRSKLVQSAYVRAQKEMRAKIHRYQRTVEHNETT